MMAAIRYEACTPASRYRHFSLLSNWDPIIQTMSIDLGSDNRNPETERESCVLLRCEPMATLLDGLLKEDSKERIDHDLAIMDLASPPKRKPILCDMVVEWILWKLIFRPVVWITKSENILTNQPNDISWKIPTSKVAGENPIKKGPYTKRNHLRCLAV